MSELLYGVVNARGELVAVGVNPDSVAREAHKVAGNREIFDLTVPEDDPRPNESETGSKPQRAFRASMLPKVTEREVMALSLKEAFARLQTAPILETAPKTWRQFSKYPEVATLATNDKMSKDVEKAFERLGVPMKYSGYAPESTGLSLTPHTLAWQLTKLEKDVKKATGVERVGLLPPPIRGRKQYPNLCRYSTAACRTGCLVLSGRSGGEGKIWKAGCILSDLVAPRDDISEHR